MKENDARKLLDEYYEARRGQVDCPEWTKPGELSKYRIAEKACIDAMTHAETIAEQRREIVSLQMQLPAVRAWLKNVAEHTRECEHDRWNQPLCTCGLDEVLK